MRKVLAITVAAVFACLGTPALGVETFPNFITIAGDSEATVKPVKWADAAGSSRLGEGAVVRWGFVRHSSDFGPGLRNRDAHCSRLMPIQRLNPLSREIVERETRTAFARWAAETNIIFVEVPQEEADVLIATQEIGYRAAWVNLRVAFSSEEENAHRIVRAAICLNPDALWALYGDSDQDVWDIRVALTHEIGHVIGLDHPRRGYLVRASMVEQMPVMWHVPVSEPTLLKEDGDGARYLYGPRVDP